MKFDHSKLDCDVAVSLLLSSSKYSIEVDKNLSLTNRSIGITLHIHMIAAVYFFDEDQFTAPSLDRSM